MLLERPRFLLGQFDPLKGHPFSKLWLLNWHIVNATLRGREFPLSVSDIVPWRGVALEKRCTAH